MNIKEKFLATIDDMVHEVLKTGLTSDSKHTQFRKEIHRQQYAIDSSFQNLMSLTLRSHSNLLLHTPAAAPDVIQADDGKVEASNDKLNVIQTLLWVQKAAYWRGQQEDSDVVSTCTWGIAGHTAVDHSGSTRTHK